MAGKGFTRDDAEGHGARSSPGAGNPGRRESSCRWSPSSRRSRPRRSAVREPRRPARGRGRDGGAGRRPPVLPVTTPEGKVPVEALAAAAARERQARPADGADAAGHRRGLPRRRDRDHHGSCSGSSARMSAGPRRALRAGKMATSQTSDCAPLPPARPSEPAPRRAPADAAPRLAQAARAGVLRVAGRRGGSRSRCSSGTTRTGLPSIAELKRYHPPQVTRVLARDGTVLGEIFVERRTVVPDRRDPAAG